MGCQSVLSYSIDHRFFIALVMDFLNVVILKKSIEIYLEMTKKNICNVISFAATYQTSEQRNVILNTCTAVITCSAVDCCWMSIVVLFSGYSC